MLKLDEKPKADYQHKLDVLLSKYGGGAFHVLRYCTISSRPIPLVPSSSCRASGFPLRSPMPDHYHEKWRSQTECCRLKPAARCLQYILFTRKKLQLEVGSPVLVLLASGWSAKTYALI